MSQVQITLTRFQSFNFIVGKLIILLFSLYNESILRLVLKLILSLTPEVYEFANLLEKFSMKESSVMSSALCQPDVCGWMGATGAPVCLLKLS